MATYLINAPQDQTMITREHGAVPGCLVYSNPAFFAPKKLARDFGDIEVGDEIIFCSNSMLRYVATISEVINATDARNGNRYEGKPVRLLKGDIKARFDNVGVGAAAERMKREGATPPQLIKPKRTGFKQGAFCERLSEHQTEKFRSWLLAT